jgi:SAM-dependent methyltransferase
MNNLHDQSATTSRRIPAPDFTGIKQKQQATWASGDFAVIGTTLQIVGESLAEAADVRAGERVLDVAAGNGNATLAAARRFAAVTSTDYVPELLEKGAARAAAEGLDVQFRYADAEDLPFDDDTFDVVLSTFGAMFTPEHMRPRARCCASSAPAAHRARQLDAGRLHRPAFQDRRRLFAAACRSEVPGSVGHGTAHRRTIRHAGHGYPHRAQALQLPLSLRCALGAGVPRLLRPNA